jgi:hypothetical protein
VHWENQVKLAKGIKYMGKIIWFFNTSFIYNLFYIYYKITYDWNNFLERYKYFFSNKAIF